MSESLVNAHEHAPNPLAEGPAQVAALEWNATLERDEPWRLAWRALLLDQRAFNTVVNSLGPLKKGFAVLLTILGIVLVARLIGWGLDYLTSPRLDSLQALVESFITGLPWYRTQVQQSPQFAVQFAQSYGLSWEAVRAALGIPTPTNQGIGIGALILNTLLVWLGYGTLAHWFARWLGGQGTWQETLGALALSYAPLLLLVVTAVPGAGAPLLLLFLLMLAGKHQAIKSAHHLAPGYTLAAVLLPYVAAVVLLLGLVLFGGALGLEQIPYIDTGIRALNVFNGLMR